MEGHHGVYEEMLAQSSFRAMVKARMKVRDPRLIAYEDKLQANERAQRLGVPIPQIYWATDDPSTIPFAQLPETYVVKPTHLACADGVLLLHQGRDLTDGKP